MKLTKKLFMSIMTLALVVVTLSASTFAWFTLGNDATIDKVQVNVTTGTGMEISRDGKSWKNKIQLAPSDGVDFRAVTSFDGKTFFDTEVGAIDATSLKYYEEVFYVRVTKANANSFNGVSLIEVNAENEKDYSVAENKWLADVSLGTGEGDQFAATTYTFGEHSDTIVEGTSKTFDALNAVKVSFESSKENGSLKVYSHETATSWGTVPTIVDFDDDNDSETAAIKIINSGLSYDYAEAKEYDTDNAQPYNCNASAFPTYLTPAQVAAAKGTAQTPATAEQQAATFILTANDDFFTAAQAVANGGILYGVVTTADDNYIYAKVTVRIWLEGWDADCINAILAQKTKIGFVLKAN